MIRHKVGTRVVATVDIREADGAFFGDWLELADFCHRTAYKAGLHKPN
jgi:hypothetical protein